MKSYKYVIIGGGTTSGYAAEEFVEQGIGEGDLCIVSAESILPMNRPPLSKGYLKDSHEDDEILINDQNFYDKNGIEVKLETCARSVDLGRNEVDLDTGERIKFGKLLIATGSSLNHLGVDGGNLQNVFYLRNINHSDKIREQAKQSKNAVVVGGGYIGTETAAGLTELGVKVSMVVPEDHLLAKFTEGEVADFFKNLYKHQGIELIFNDKAVSFRGNGKVEEVELESGKRLPADMVVVGAGVKPNVKLFTGTALRINEAIQVNEYCETGVENVYAAGDVVEFPDQIFNKKRHVEHWEHAFEQGKHAAKVMTGKREPYVFVPFFFSDVFDLSYEYFGDQEGADFSATRGNVSDGNFSQWWFKDKICIAAFVMSSRPDEEGEKARTWIKEKVHIDQDRIDDESVSLKSLELQSQHHRNDPNH
ncbi:MAG: FAD-dependent oxidoreductase [Bacteroidales bacterium]|nr:FAD-dependent oxidoreductase [Bacteroidales bacterium]